MNEKRLLEITSNIIKEDSPLAVLPYALGLEANELQLFLKYVGASEEEIKQLDLLYRKMITFSKNYVEKDKSNHQMQSVISKKR